MKIQMKIDEDEFVVRIGLGIELSKVYLKKPRFERKELRIGKLKIGEATK